MSTIDLDTMICQLPIKSRGFFSQPKVHKCISRLHSELNQAGLKFKPRFFLGDEWFSPEGMCAISIPFYLAHPKLVKLEKQIVGYAEGETEVEFMRLLRHEAGHCFDHAYRVSDTRRWKNLFGKKSIPYRPEKYPFDSKSKDFVNHLPHHYAQSHPEEDFAETFAVWLDPKQNWQVKYALWPKAFAKLCAIQDWIIDLGPHPRRWDEWSALPHLWNRSRMTLRTFYKKRGFENV